jgi:CHAT domain-containing protein
VNPAVREAALIVALAETPGQAPLPNVYREVDTLTRLLPEDRRTTLIGPQATEAAVRAALPDYRWVHFCCHADQNLTDPSRGGLLLHDGRLTSTDIGAGVYRGEFAFMSACKTATGGASLPDEAITLAAALHYTGYRHVIATLWSVWDASAADVADAVYGDLVRDGALHPGRTPEALHHAVRKLRVSEPGRPSTWTPFLHIGP